MEFKNGDMVILRQAIAMGYLSSPLARRRVFSMMRSNTNININKINVLYHVDFIDIYLFV